MSKKILGIELGSTRIKSVLIDENTTVVAQGSYEWENQLVDQYVSCAPMHICGFFMHLFVLIRLSVLTRRKDLESVTKLSAEVTSGKQK